MNSGSISNLAQVVMAVVVVLGVIVGVIAWFYRRGAQETAFTESLTENTAANKEVAAELRDFKTTAITMIHELDTRVSVLESQRGK